MPLDKSPTKEALRKNIKEMKSAGYPTKQAIAASLDTVRKAGATIPKHKGLERKG